MRYFVSFKQTTTLPNKVMVFTNLTRNQVQDTMVRFYGTSWDKIHSEQELAQLLPNIYQDHSQWVEFGSTVHHQTKDNGYIKYPLTYTAEHSVSIEPITKWFRVAKPEIKQADLESQLAVHYEEFAELAESLGHSELAKNVMEYVQEMRNKQFDITLDNLSKEAQTAILDAICDQVVTCAGVAYFMGANFDGALTEVNQSNFSKFVNGKPLINEYGKITKGKDYFKPELTQFLSK